MANEKNLVPANQRSKSEARENSRKGGIQSGKSRRAKKTLKAILKNAMPIKLKELPPDLCSAILRAAQMKATKTNKEMTVAEIIMGGMIRCSVKGNSMMMKLLLDLLGESPDIKLREREVKLKETAADLDDGDKGDGIDVQIYLPDNERGDGNA